MKLEFYIGLSKNTQISNFQIRPVAVEFLHADGRTDGRKDMTTPRITFHNFANAPKKAKWHLRPSVKYGCLWNSDFTKLVIAQGHHVVNFDTDFHENRLKDVDSTSINSFTP
jgi:hypothetical protein